MSAPLAVSASPPSPSFAARLRRICYVVAQITWGFPQTFVGFLFFCIYARCEHGLYRGAVVTYWDKGEGLSLGLFLFLPRSAHLSSELSSADISDMRRERSARLHAHEYGHTIQSLFFGPFYLVIIGIPSLLWASFPPLARRWRQGDRGYYSFITERFADRLSTRFPHPEDSQECNVEA